MQKQLAVWSKIQHRTVPLPYRDEQHIPRRVPYWALKEYLLLHWQWTGAFITFIAFDLFFEAPQPDQAGRHRLT